MPKRKWRWIPLLAMFVFFEVSPMAYGDLYSEWVQITKGVPGLSNGTRIVKTYYTSNAFRADIGEEIMIMDFDSMIMYQLNTKDGTYTKSNINETDLMPERDGEEIQAFQQMLKKVIESLQIDPTNETKTISGYVCRKHNATLMLVDVGEYWLSKDVVGYKELRMIADKMANVFEKDPVLKHLNIAGVVDKLDGFPVQMVIKATRGTTTITLKSIKKKPLSKNLFKVPEGYTIKQIN